MADRYSLKFMDIPPQVRVSAYGLALRDFAKHPEHKSARVDMPGKRVGTVQVGLLKARKEAKMPGVKVVTRGEEVYLLRAF